MAVKKTTKSDDSAAPKAKKAAPKKAAPKAAATKTKAAPKKAAPKKAASAAPKKAAPKKAAPKLTDKQRDFLRKIHGAGPEGYTLEKSAEKRSIEALVEKKLLKKGPKDKAKGTVPYMLTKTGEKLLATPAAPAS